VLQRKDVTQANSDWLVSMDPPLPVYLFNVVSALRDKSAKGYPIKKV
jgi:hypothetical protein